jgi:hypothetical protein
MGVYTLARGKGSYEGEWRNGKAHGVGKFTGPTGEEVRHHSGFPPLILRSMLIISICLRLKEYGTTEL